MTPKAPQYEELLSVIINTRLLYNTLEELEDMLDNHSIHSNGIRRACPTYQRLRSTYRDLHYEVMEMTSDEIDLVELLGDYKHTWAFYSHWLRRYAEDRRFAAALFECFARPATTEGMDTKVASLLHRALSEGVNIPLLLLFILRALPGYGSRRGDVPHFARDYDDVIELLHIWTRSRTIYATLPAVAEARMEMNKCRIMLIHHVTRILDSYISLTDPEGTYRLNSRFLRRLSPVELDGYWNETGGRLLSTEFWHIESTLHHGMYFATHWHKDATETITGIRYTLTLTEDDRGMVAVMTHPRYMEHRVKGVPYTDSDLTTYTLTLTPSEDSAVESMQMSRRLASSSWRERMDLHRVTDPDVCAKYHRWFRRCHVDKPFGHIEYTYHPCIHAITQEAVYLCAEQDGEYYRIPKESFEGLSQIHMDDNAGLMQMDGHTYIVFDDLLLYIPTTPDSLSLHHITRVSHII